MDVTTGIIIFGAGFFLSGLIVSSGATVKINEARRQGWIEGVSDIGAIEMLHRHLHSNQEKPEEEAKAPVRPQRAQGKKLN
jgi:hypothetical protein